MLNEHRRAAIRRYAEKALSKDGAGKALRDPAIIFRAIRTLSSNRNLRKVPAEELLGNAENAVHALARLANPAMGAWPVGTTTDIADLGELFRKHGSDKSTEHDYFEVYGSLLDRSEPLRILEIGLGTNNLAFQSNMGLGGRPGASLRAFRDWALKAEVVGADIDRGVLFEEERIRTFFVDQTDPASLKLLGSEVGTGFDLIIDDGLHLPHANLNTIEALLPLLKPGGTMVIEDIDAIHLHYWHVAGSILGDARLLERRGGYLFLVRSQS